MVKSTNSDSWNSKSNNKLRMCVDFSTRLTKV